MDQRRAYESISLHQAADRKLEIGGKRIVTRFEMRPPAVVSTPPIAFGVETLGAAKLRQVPVDDEKGGPRPRPGISFFIVRDAVVHTGLGLVTAGGYFFKDFLYHVHLPRLRGWSGACGPQPDGAFVMPESASTHRLEHAAHLLAGNGHNYYHWMIDVLSRLDRETLAAHCDSDRLQMLVPKPDRDFQRQSFDLLFHDAKDVSFCGLDTILAVDNLYVVPDLSGGGFIYHPCVLQSFARMRADCGLEFRPARQRIYISRRDTRHRRLLNEDEVIDAVRAAGFEIVELTGMPVVEQMRLFAEASHIVAPHGAGLTNLVFANPGATLLELHMDAYTQWSFRRLCGVVGLHYGCLIGTSATSWDRSAHVHEWRIDVSALRSVLASERFAGSERADGAMRSIVPRAKAW